MSTSNSPQRRLTLSKVFYSKTSSRHQSYLLPKYGKIDPWLSIFWLPYTQKNIQALESVQRRSARFVFNNCSPYDSVFAKLGWSSLAERQNEHTLIMLIHRLIDINIDSLLPPCPCNHCTCGLPNRFWQLPAAARIIA